MTGTDFFLAVVATWTLTALVVIAMRRSAKREITRKEQPVLRLWW